MDSCPVVPLASFEGRLAMLEKRKSTALRAQLKSSQSSWLRRSLTTVVHQVTRVQEAYVLSIHGTKFQMVVVHFRDEYLKHVQSRLLPNNQEVYVRRSKWFELKEPDGRVDRLFGCIGLTGRLLWSR